MDRRPRGSDVRRALATAVLVSLTVATAATRADELTERATIRREVLMAGERKDFARLEALSGEFKRSGARTSSGIWKLTLFYAGVNGMFDARSREESYWAIAQTTAANWVKAYPASPTAHLAYATFLLNRGWSYRGSGYASTVDPRDWQPFIAFTQQARSYLEANKKIGSQDPHWYELMEVIAYRQSWNEQAFAQLIDEGLARYPSFYQLYFAAIDYHAPKWGGSAEAIEKFASDAVRKTSATEGSGMYTRIYWYASQTQYDESLFTNSLVLWETMKKGIDDVLAKYPDQWNINNFAKFACLAGDGPKTAELTRRIQPSPLPEVWRDPALYQQCKAGILRAPRRGVG